MCVCVWCVCVCVCVCVYCRNFHWNREGGCFQTNWILTEQVCMELFLFLIDCLEVHPDKRPIFLIVDIWV